MQLGQLDRARIRFKRLSERRDRIYIERDHVAPGARKEAPDLEPDAAMRDIGECLRRARNGERARMLAFGAHMIKSGLAPVLMELIEEGWLTHLATNGASAIHDWEFAYQGHSSEFVKENIARGEFGIWEETGLYLNLALLIGAFEGKGYGQAVGAMIEREGLEIPSEACLREVLAPSGSADWARIAAAADLLEAVMRFHLEPGWLPIAHPFKRYSLFAAAYRLGVPLTVHPMIGHDIIYAHPMNNCAAVGRAAQRDFLAFAEGITRLKGGVYLSVGSAVMSPMIFEKALSMAQNLALASGDYIDGHLIAVVDLAPAQWDWTQGEPPWDAPEFYVRFMKTFSRMGGKLRYVSSDNRRFILALREALQG